MANYAVLQDGSNVCIAVMPHNRTDLHHIDKNYVSIPVLDEAYVMRIYDKENQHWTDEWLECGKDTGCDYITEKLNAIETKIQINEDLQAFYDDIVKEVVL